MLPPVLERFFRFISLKTEFVSASRTRLILLQESLEFTHRALRAVLSLLANGSMHKPL